MATRNSSSSNEPGLRVIANLEAAIIRLHDEKIDQGINAAELAQQRPAIQQLAATIGERLRAEYLGRRRTNG